MSKRINHAALRNNPCLKEQEQSFACLNDNDYNRDKCEVHFDNYNLCKKFWNKVYNERRRNGVTPYLPELEDREKVKEEYKYKIKL